MSNFFKKFYERTVAFMNAPHRRRPIAAMLLLTAAIQMFAAGNGLSGINEATSMVTSYFDPGTNWCTQSVLLSVSSAVSRFTPNGRVATPTRARLPPHGSEPVSS